MLYKKGNNKIKREIIGSIFPEKPAFDGMHYQTARVNEAAALIYNVRKDFSENENEKKDKNFELSNLVPVLYIYRTIYTRFKEIGWSVDGLDFKAIF